MVVITHLGSTSVSRSGTLVTGRAAYGRRLALLAILAGARGRATSRDKVVALLWPESPTDRARHQLSDTLYILRGALGDGVVQATGEDLVLNPDLACSDVADFERLIDEGRLESAVELYGGPLLDGFHLSDCAEFERWLDSERMRLGQQYARALEELATRAEAAGDHAAAVGWWRRLAAHDPHSGRLALGLMRALEATGDRAGAIRHSRIHAELLQQDFDAQPDSDVAAFAERLRLAPAPQRLLPAAPAQPGPPPEPARTEPSISPAAARQAPQRRRVYSALAAVALIVTIVVGIVYGATSEGEAVHADLSVAVLPFVNMSAEGGTDYFADGLSEQIISVLSRVPGLRVAARTSSFALRDARLDIRVIADTLDVATVLEGSVRRDGDRLRVTAQLIDAATGYHIWSGDYDRQMQQVVEVQDEIARDIARALALRVPAERTRATSRRTPDLQAYDLYLRALYLRDTFTPEALSEALRYLDRAIELDPSFARAHALKATVLGPAIFWNYIPLEPSLTEARAAIARALALDPAVSEAHGALGMVELFFDRDFPAAERALQRAVQLNPNDHLSWHMLANYYSAMGQFEDAADARARSAAIDPLNPRIGFMLAVAYAEAGRHAEALAQFERMIRMQPMHPIALGLGSSVPAAPAQVYLLQGRYREAVEDYVRIATLRGGSTAEVDSLRTAFQQGGMPAFWRRWLSFDLRHSAGTPNTVRVATIHALAGDAEQALAWLERARAERNPALVFVFAHPVFAFVRDDPRFQRVFVRMGFTAN